MPASARAKEILSRLPSGPVVGAEIGIWRGRLSWLLLSRPDLTLFMVDNWKGIPELAHLGYGDEHQPENKAVAMEKTDFAADRRHILHLDSTKAAETVDDGSLDFVFIDADHSYGGVSSDIKVWSPKLRAGCLLGGHDYANENAGTEADVKRAVDEAAVAFGWTLDLGTDSTWFVRLP